VGGSRDRSMAEFVPQPWRTV